MHKSIGEQKFTPKFGKASSSKNNVYFAETEDLASVTAQVLGGNKDVNRIYARRISICVNACAGLPDEALKEVLPNYDAYCQVCDQRDELLAILEGLTDDIQSLIGESSGVYGLHLNGDGAPWEELEAGGRFERLSCLPVAHATIAKVKGAAA